MASDAELSITLFRGWLDRGKHVWSPFVVKIEARLRLAGVPYATDAGSPRTAPRGKVPYVACRSADLARPDTTLSDSTLIIAGLVEQGVLPDLNAPLSPSARVQDLAIRALLEEKLYFYHTYERWTQNYYTMRDHILWTMAWPVRAVVGNIIYRGTTQTLHGQGTGRFTADEVAAFRLEIWETLAGLLAASRDEQQAAFGKGGDGDGAPFWALGGDAPTEADCAIFGFIVSVLMCTAAPESQKVVRGLPVLVEYASRIHDRYFPDYEKWA